MKTVVIRLLFSLLAVVITATGFIPMASAARPTGHELRALPLAASSTTITSRVSTYDYWNNSPPGYGIEYARQYGYPTVHRYACCAAGGTYDNPITFAAQDHGVLNLAPGTRIYVPYLKRYFILEDLCATCYTSEPQVDLWVGQVSAAQEHDTNPHNIVNLWRKLTIVINPARGLPTRSFPLKDYRI